MKLYLPVLALTTVHSAHVEQFTSELDHHHYEIPRFLESPHECRKLWEKMHKRHCWNSKCKEFSQGAQAERQFEKMANKFCRAYRTEENLYAGYQFFLKRKKKNGFCKGYKDEDECEKQKKLEAEFLRYAFTREAYHSCGQYLARDLCRINDCKNNECQHGSICIDGVAGYGCFCKEGTEGKRCEINADDCPNNRCENGATCVDGINGYTCSCAAGWEGKFCEHNIDDCENHGCQNGGTCVDGLETYTCTCAETYGGEFCEGGYGQITLTDPRFTLRDGENEGAETDTQGSYDVEYAIDGNKDDHLEMAIPPMRTSGESDYFWVTVNSQSVSSVVLNTRRENSYNHESEGLEIKLVDSDGNFHACTPDQSLTTEVYNEPSLELSWTCDGIIATKIRASNTNSMSVYVREFEAFGYN